MVTLQQRYGDDDRILIQALHGGTALLLAGALAGWAASVWRGRQPADRSGWLIAVLVAFIGVLLSLGYDAGRTAADQDRAAPGRGVHGTLTVTGCSPLEDGYACEGTFRADDESFTVERVSAWPDHDPGPSLDGWVSGPRPLGMYDGGPADRTALYVLGAFGSLVAGVLAVVVGRRLRRPAA